MNIRQKSESESIFFRFSCFVCNVDGSNITDAQTFFVFLFLLSEVHPCFQLKHQRSNPENAQIKATFIPATAYSPLPASVILLNTYVLFVYLFCQSQTSSVLWYLYISLYVCANRSWRSPFQSASCHFFKYKS